MELDKRFRVSTLTIDNEINFNGCNIEQFADYTVQLSMNEYVRSIKPLIITKSQRTMSDDILQSLETQK